MEMPLAKAYLKTSHVMEWVKSLNSFDNQPSIVMIIRPRIDFNFKKHFINILIKILFGGLLGRVFDPVAGVGHQHLHDGK